MKTFYLLISFLCVLFLGCKQGIIEFKDQAPCKCASSEISTNIETRGALLASRISSLEELKSIIKIEYTNESGITDKADSTNSGVRLKHCSNGKEVTSVLNSGLSQDDITDARDGDFWDRLSFLFHSPYSVSNRNNLTNIYILSRRRQDLFGWGDPAFYDLTQAIKAKISSKDIAYKKAEDNGSKGYINSFNHITAQAIITSCYSEELANFIADVHELHNMSELTTGMFTKSQLLDPETNPVDNYVDMINNEWGQELGKKLKEKYSITYKTKWTPDLLAKYMNSVLSYYGWAFQIDFDPFRADEEVILRFSEKINWVSNAK